MPRIALFGGSFDPVHFGHLLVAQAAREELQLIRLFFIPAAQSPFKPTRQPSPANQRLRLLRLAEPFRGRMLKGFPLAISSSEIRARVKAGLPLEPLVPAEVAEAIRNNG